MKIRLEFGTKTGQTYSKEVESIDWILNKSIGDTVDCTPIGLKGVEAIITGGSDISGTPMRPGLHGKGVSYSLLAGGPGIKIRRKGERRRKRIRGEVIGEKIVQINFKVTKGENILKNLKESKNESA
jgi:small subunit ribosomal protein S6e